MADLVPRDKRVVEHNELINARYDFPVIIHRLFVAGLLLIDKDDEDLKTYRVPVSEMLDVFGMSTNVYAELKRRWPDLAKNSALTFERVGKNGKPRLGMIPLFASLEYQDGEGCIEMKFNPELRSRLLAFKGNFTRYELDDVKAFTSQYSFRIYKWLKQVEGLRTDRTFELDELRGMLMLEDKYANFKDFRVNVLDVAQKELDAHADISFDYDPQRTGRKVTHVTFKIRLSARVQQEITREIAAPPPRPDVPARQLPLDDAPDAFEAWLEALSPLERGAFEARVEARLAKRGEAGVPRGLARWQIAARDLYEEEQAGTSI